MYEIYLVDFSSNVEKEIKKIRPAITVSKREISRLELVCVMPISSRKPMNKSYEIFIKKDSHNKLYN